MATFIYRRYIARRISRTSMIFHLEKRPFDFIYFLEVLSHFGKCKKLSRLLIQELLKHDVKNMTPLCIKQDTIKSYFELSFMQNFEHNLVNQYLLEQYLHGYTSFSQTFGQLLCKEEKYFRTYLTREFKAIFNRNDSHPFCLISFDFF